MQKIVCVGFPKTCTKSIAKVFNMLKYKTVSNPLCNDNVHPEYCILDRNIKYYLDDKYDNTNIKYFKAFHDIPYSLNYKKIYKKYPKSKFILSIRDSEEWFNSIYTYQYIENAKSKKFFKHGSFFKKLFLKRKTCFLFFSPRIRHIFFYFVSKTIAMFNFSFIIFIV